MILEVKDECLTLQINAVEMSRHRKNGKFAYEDKTNALNSIRIFGLCSFFEFFGLVLHFLPFY